MDIDQLKEQLIADPEVRRMIAARAYEIFLDRRNVRDAHPAEDWLMAENEILPTLMDQMLDHNRRALATDDASDPVASRAFEHMQEELDRALTVSSESAASSQPAPKKTAAAKTATRSTAKSSTAKTAANKAAPKKPAAKKAAAKKAAPKKAASAKAPAASKDGKKPASKPVRRKAAPKQAKPE